MLSRIEADQRLNRFIDRLKGSCGINDSDLSDIMGCKVNRSLSRLPAANFAKLSARFNVALETILANEVDFEVLQSQYADSVAKLPALYTWGPQSSSRFSSVYMFEHIGQNIGSSAQAAVRQRFQIHPGQLENTKAHNNILLPRDICGYVASYYGLDELEKMGFNSLLRLRHQIVALGLDQITDRDDYLDGFVYGLVPNHVERNYHWDITAVTRDTVTITAHATLGIAEAFRETTIYSLPLERLRLGFIKAMMHAFSGKTPQVRQVRSLTGGDGRDEYIVEHPQGQAPVRILQ